MAPVLKVLEFLRITRIARDYIRRFPGRGASLLAFLGRKLNTWCRFWLGIFRFRRLQPAVVREYVVAASAVPPSASLHEHAERQLAAVAQTVGVVDPPVLASITAEHPQTLHPPHSLGGRSLSNRNTGNLSVVSIQSSASDRYSIITNSHESKCHGAPLGQPSRPRRATYPQLGCGLDQLRSRERATWPPASTTRPRTHDSPRLEIITVLPSTHGDGKPPSPPPMNEICREQSSTHIILDVQYPSTESIPISSSTNLPRITDEPFSVDYSTGCSSSDSSVVILRDEPAVGSPTSSNSPTSEDVNLPEGHFLHLIHSDQIPRYTKDATIPRVGTYFDLKPLTTKFPYFPEPNGFEQDSRQQDGGPWIPATHPDGALYFYDEERRLFTDSDMHDKTMRDEIEDFYNYLQRVIRIGQISIPSNNYDLVLDIMAPDNGEEEKRISWSYYYACHEARCLFWLETYDASYMISELFGVKSPAHVKHRLEALYWNHWSLYPVVFGDRRLPLDAYDELLGILMHGCVDVITSKSSTLPYDDDTMHKIIQLVQGAKEAKHGLGYYTAGITRLLSFFAHWRFLYFHGQKHARLIRDQSVYDKPKHERSLHFTIVSPLLFLAPDDHLRNMEKLWTDEVIIESVWRNHVMMLLGEWGDMILWSTVLLSVNVGFLAIPGVVLSNLSGTNITSASEVVIFASPSQIASSLSVVGSIGSIVIGLLLVRHHRTKPKEDPAGASTYLFQISHRTFGLEPMAIVFSLPWGLLMWSMVIFFIALLLFCFSISNHPTRIFVAIMSVLIAALIGWGVWTAWESENYEDEVWEKSLAVFRRTRAALFGRVKEFILFHMNHTRRVPVDRFTLNSQLNEGRV